VTPDLHSVLRKYWGYDQFRPLQSRIVESLIGGHDTCVVMPTGGGKSLCYQLPAVVSGRTAVVVSPLIALMQDQAAQLEQMGIPAAALNSQIPWQEQQNVMRRAVKGEYRLLYVSPERLLKEEFIEYLSRVPLAFFAIDEAHCISEWGHEFRPEYRQLRRLRELFPDQPIAAFTASATKRVRHDILRQLSLRDPHKYIASFHRPNLSYLVRACDGKMQERLLLSAIEAYAGATMIVYAPTIARVEETVAFFGRNGVEAVPYHGKMETDDRSQNQERWMSDEVRVLVGTIAFGLGINKPGVRAVIHLALPKSIEQYYQEAGRAGRDGAPADCVLLWQARDAGLLAYFNGKIADSQERQRAWESYHSIRRFAESDECRHRQICLHFGETPKWEKCNACDVCAAEPDWMLAPASPRAGPAARRAQAGDEIARPTSPRPRRATSSIPESALQQHMREWRRAFAKQRGVPAFMILTDASLADLCRREPSTFEELLEVTGIGERKAQSFGKEILMALHEFATR
jgi:ATP-dependent DNA helicase RecQ